MDLTYKVLISGDWGTGKTTLALDFSTQVGGTLVSFDYEDGQTFYVVDDPARASRADGRYFVRRIKRPSLYEVKFLIEKIRDPERRAAAMTIDKQPLDLGLLSPAVKKLATDITTGKTQVSGIIFDTVTRLGDLTATKVFGSYADEKVEKLSQIIWTRVKDELSEVFYSIIELDLHLILTAWAKTKYDSETRKSTNELIADVLKNVNAFVDLSLMLEHNPRATPQHFLPPRARVLKSRIRRLPAGLLVPEATWETIFSATPAIHVQEDRPDGQAAAS